MLNTLLHIRPLKGSYSLESGNEGALILFVFVIAYVFVKIVKKLKR